MLKYEPIHIPFVGGLDTKSDPKTLQPGKLLRLENGEFTRRGSVRSRPGHTGVNIEPLTAPTQGDYTLGDGDYWGTPAGIGAFNKQLALLTDRAAYVYTPRHNAWAYTSAYNPITHTLESFASGNVEQLRGEVATSNGVTVYAWEEPGPTVRFAAVDATTGAYLGGNSKVTGYSKPRCFAIGNTLMVTFVDEANDTIRAWKITSDDVATSAAADDYELIADLNTSGNRYTTVEVNEQFAVVFYDSDDAVVTGMRLAQIGPDGLIGVTGAFTDSDDDPLSNLAAAYATQNGLLYLCYAITGPEVKQAVVAVSDFTPIAANSETPGDDVFQVAIGVADVVSSDGSELETSVVWTEDPGGDNDLQLTVFWRRSTIGTENTVTVRHAYLASESFYDGSNVYYLLGHESRSGLQHSYYLYNWRGELIGTVCPREADSQPAAVALYLPCVRAAADGKYQCAVVFRRALDARNDDIPVFEHSSLKHCIFDPTATPHTEQLGKGMYATGSMLWHFDGRTMQESGFLMFPDMLDADITEPATTGFATTDDVLSYRVYYCKRMRSGEVFRSAALTINRTVVDADTELQLVIPTLSFTAESGVWVEVYRTQANRPGIFYLCSGQDPSVVTGDNCWLNNDLTADSLTFADAMTDAVLETKPTDYLTPGEAPNFPPPGPSFLKAIGNRLFAVGGAIEFNQIWFSKPYIDGLPVEFSVALITDDTADPGGQLVGIGHLDEIPVFFKEGSIFTLDGDGLDQFAVGNGYRASVLSTDLGVVNPGTIVSTPMGVAFFSNKGFYSLSRDGALTYLGADVEAFNSLNFVAGSLIPDTTQVVWIADDGKALMFDYQFGQWGTWTNYEGKSCTIWDNDQFAYLRTDNQVFIRDTSLYTDAGNSYVVAIRTAPIRPFPPATLFYKMNRYQVLGQYRSLHYLRVKLYYNRELAPFETIDWDPSEVIDLTLWGDGTWGVGTWGGDTNAENPDDYHFERRPQRMKAQTISFEFEGIHSGTPGAAFELSELLVSCAPYPTGLSRLSARRKI